MLTLSGPVNILFLTSKSAAGELPVNGNFFNEIDYYYLAVK